MTAGNSAKVLRVWTYEASSFGATAPTAGSTWTHWPVLEDFSHTPTQKRDEATEASDDGQSNPSTNTVKMGVCSGKTKMWQGNGALGFGGGLTNPTSFYLQKMLESAFSSTAGSWVGTTVGSSSGAGNTGDLVVASTTGADLGACIICQGSSSLPEARYVIKVTDGTHLKLDRDLTVAANYASSATVYGSWILTPALTSYAKQIFALVKESSHQYLYYDGQVNKLGISGFKAGEGLRWDIGIEFASWARGPGFSAPTTDTDNQTSFSGSPLVAKGSVFSLGGTEYCIADLSLDFGLKKDVVECASGTNGRQGMALTAVEPSGSFTLYYDSTVLDMGQLNTQGAGSLFLTNADLTTASTGATAAKGSVGIFFPNLEVTCDHAKQNNQQALKVSFKGRRPTVAQIANGLTKSVYLSQFGGA